MSALTGPRVIVQKLPALGSVGPLPVAADAKIFHGGMVGKSGGYAVAGATDSDAIVGVWDSEMWSDVEIGGQAYSVSNAQLLLNVIDNTGGANGARQIQVKNGVFAFENNSGDPVDGTDVGSAIGVTDDQTVQRTVGVKAGVLMGFDPLSGKPLVRIQAGA